MHGKEEGRILNPRQREIMHMLAVEGYSAAKAAKAVGMPTKHLYVELTHIKARVGCWGPMHRLVSWYLQVYLGSEMMTVDDVIPMTRQESLDGHAINPPTNQGKNTATYKLENLPWYLRRNRWEWKRLRAIEQLAKEAGIVPDELADPAEVTYDHFDDFMHFVRERKAAKEAAQKI